MIWACVVVVVVDAAVAASVVSLVVVITACLIPLSLSLSGASSLLFPFSVLFFLLLFL
jgi:hypothetical protein